MTAHVGEGHKLGQNKSLSCMVCVKDNCYVNVRIKFYELARDECFPDFDYEAQKTVKG